MKSYFYFEVAPYLTSILKEGVLRQANNNSVKKTQQLKPMEAATFATDESMDHEGALL